MLLNKKYVSLKCPSCKKEFELINRKYDDELTDTTKCSNCDFESSRLSFDFIEEINQGDKVKYNGKDPSLYNGKEGVVGKILGIIKPGENKFENTIITINNVLFAIEFEGYDNTHLYLYHRELFDRCGN
jgi:predicted RNA-binding Zn-ribbon protein involved in translation (DUF1610 family)